MNHDHALPEMIRKGIRFLCDVKVRVGCDPEGVPAPALILFPLRPAMLCCGLAGLLTLRSGNLPPGAGADLPRLFDQACQKNLPALLAGAILSKEYLGGPSLQQAMGRELLGLKSEEGFRKIFYGSAEAGNLVRLCAVMKAFLADEERLLEAQADRFSTADLEGVNRGMVTLRDLVWGLERDILDNAGKIIGLAGVRDASGVAPGALPKYRKLNILLNALDRLEVRGRDSAGIEISFVAEDGCALESLIASLVQEGFGDEIERRTAPGDLGDGSITGLRILPVEEMGALGTDFKSVPLSPVATPLPVSFTYKTAAIIGELGRNVRELRRRISGDRLFHAFARLPVRFETALTHTRWASVGSITEENCHPIGNFTPLSQGPASSGLGKNYPAYGIGPWTIHVALNGDIDNYQPLREALEAGGVAIAPEVTTDTKIIPLKVESYLQAGHDLAEAFRRALCDFEGSHAIALISNVEPGKVFLALRGSGQSIYIGIAPDRYLFSSELYGLVEETPFFIKMDGEKPRRPESPDTIGQIAILDQDAPGGAEGIRAFAYDGTPLPFQEAMVRPAEITTRDIDRGDHPHYFLKEIGEAAHSVRKTLRGKYRIERNGRGERVVFNLGEDIVPAEIRKALCSGKIRRIAVIGHGTAAVAAFAVADAMRCCLAGSGILAEAKIASELSGFCLDEDLKDTLIIPVTQSGTTTDTNRAVAMARERGAAVIAIVNRRQSDITAKADGVFYTSDGRDIEMAVASTKAFYSQIVAGNVLALYLAGLLSTLTAERIAEELRRLERAPELMGKVLARKEEIRCAAEKLVKRKRFWAVVGSGPNKAAAEEIRIKLSELCYQTISADVVENKKHIDLSAEPLILVCVSGSPETVTADILKDVAIFKAHKSAVIVFADEGDERFDGVADAVIPIPRAPQPLPVILNTVAGHLFGYFAACAIDADALFLREFKSRLNLIMVEQAKRSLSVLECLADSRLRRLVNDFTESFQALKRQGGFSQTRVRTITDLLLLLKYAGGKLPLEDFRHDFPGTGELSSPIDLLDMTLGLAVDELSRPIDAIRHQAKTVTVGTSRKAAPAGMLFDLLAELSFAASSLPGTNGFVLAAIQRAVSAVNGYTLYGVNHLDADGSPGDAATIEIRKRGGVSVAMPSRFETPGRLIGTKKGIVASGKIYGGQGKSDGASVVVVPLKGEDDHVSHLLLIHVAFNEALSIHERKELLGTRANDIRDLIQEVNLAWDDRLLAKIPVGLLLGEPVEVIAGLIRQNLLAEVPEK